jgi:hypothetical protein
MLYGNVTGQPYGWALPDEMDLMLAAAAFGADSCPPAIGGHPDDWYLRPADGDYFFWQAWHERHRLDQDRGREPRTHPWVTEPEITFYCGTHCTAWLWSGAVSYPLCVSYGRLRRIRAPRRGRVWWILDSRGFSELSQHGRWTISPEEYAADVARYDQQIGGLQWAAPQDWMCEEPVIRGGMLGRVRCAGTGLSVEEHQRRTVANFIRLTAIWPRYSTRPCPFIPVLQGDLPGAYLRCYEMYLDAGVQLGEEHPLAGVGSVCRRQSTGEIAAIASALRETGLELHWFGLKLTGLRHPEVQRDIASPFAWGGTQSLDSASWSLDARYGTRLPGCSHVSLRTGQPNKCSNCPRYATWWRTRVLAALEAAQRDPARLTVQGQLFSAAPASLPSGVFRAHPPARSVAVPADNQDVVDVAARIPRGRPGDQDAVPFNHGRRTARSEPS